MTRHSDRIFLVAAAILLVAPVSYGNPFDALKDKVKDIGEDKLKEVQEESLSVAPDGQGPSTTTSSEPDQSNVPPSWDIRGIQVGMNVHEVERQMRALNTNQSIGQNLCSSTQFLCYTSPKQEHIDRLGPNPYVGRIDLGFRTNQITVMFLGPPGAQESAYISRGQSYEVGEQPTLEATVNALVGKYGQPTHTVKKRKSMELAWEFDIDGEPITGLSQQNSHSPYCRLSGVGDQHLGNATYSSSRYRDSRCDYSLRARINATEDGLVNGFGITLTDVRRMIDRIARRQAALSKSSEEERAREIEEAQGKEPEL